MSLPELSTFLITILWVSYGLTQILYYTEKTCNLKTLQLISWQQQWRIKKVYITDGIFNINFYQTPSCKRDNIIKLFFLWKSNKIRFNVGQWKFFQASHTFGGKARSIPCKAIQRFRLHLLLILFLLENSNKFEIYW